MRVICIHRYGYLATFSQTASAERKEQAMAEKERPRKGAREKTFTDKGREYLQDIRMKNIHTCYKNLEVQMNIIDALMQSDEDIGAPYSEWLKLYEKFLDADDEYRTLLSGEEIKCHAEKMDTSFFILRSFKASAEQYSTKSRPSAEKDNVSEKSVSVRDSASHTGRSRIRSNVSRNPSKVSSLASSILREKQRKVELEAKQTAMKEKHRLEMAKLKLKMEEEELDIKTEIKVCNAKEDILDNFMKTRSQVGLSEGVSGVKNDNVGVQNNANVNVYNSSVLKGQGQGQGQVNDQPKNCDVGIEGVLQCVTDSQQLSMPPSLAPPTFPLQPQFPIPANPPVTHGPPIISSPVVPSLPFMNSVFQTPIGIPGSSAPPGGANYTGVENKSVSHVARLLNKPPTEVRKFSGDPLDYKRFLRQFHSRVVVNTDTDEERMNYLEQFTTGEANKVVCGYGYLDDGYQAALEELAHRYGNPRVIVSSFIQKALDWPAIRPDDPKGLDEYSIFLSECLHAVRSVDSGGSLDSLEDVKRLLSKLPFHLHDRWRGQMLGDSSVRRPSFEQFVTFVRNEARKTNDPVFGREAISKYNAERKEKRQPQKVKGSFAATATEKTKKEDKRPDNRGSAQEVSKETGTTANRKKEDGGSDQFSASALEKPCIYCSSSGHTLLGCDDFEAQVIGKRLSFLRTKGICFGQGHMRADCNVKQRCDKCKRRHPTVLHTEYTPPTDTQDENAQKVSASANLESDGSQDTEQDCTMAIIPIRIKRKNGLKEVSTYAFLDTGSNASFISEDLMRSLGCEGKRVEITIETMGSPVSTHTYSLKGLEILGIGASEAIEMPPVYTRKDMPVSHKHIPLQSDLNKWDHLKDVEIPEIDASIGLLIGINVPDAYSPLEIRTGPTGSPHATRTRIGWIPWNIMRDQDSATYGVTANYAKVVANQIGSLEKLVRDAIDMDFPERAIDDKRGLSREDVQFVEKMKSATFVGGHHMLPLPFKEDAVQLPDNRGLALRRLNSLRRRLIADEGRLAEYTAFMEKVVTNGYAEEVPTSELQRNDGKVWYIPHHGVNHPKTGKFRVVFDCSSTFHGVSLNNQLLQGPNLTSDLLTILISFREEAVALNSDIEAMFYQVLVPKEDCDCMRYYWWKDGDLSKDPIVYRMKVHVFGAVSSPACSNYALRSTAIGKNEEYGEEITECLSKYFYVDDFLRSVTTDARAIHMAKQVTDLCRSGGFHLHKWISNRRPVLESIPKQERAKGIEALDLDTDDLPVERALGVIWSVESDCFGFRIKMKEDLGNHTRRTILSTVSSVFDPLGFAAPFVLSAKILLQEMCRRKLDWDEVIPDDQLQKWEAWLRELPLLDQIEIPRCYKPEDFGEVKSIQIHNFADASDSGYGTVSYLRLVNADDKISCAFLASRARVAPLKKTTIPRMELTAATVALRINKMLVSSINYPVVSSYFWTDSESVLKYIANDTARYHTFVANRVSVIRDASSVEQWRYVSTADHASRGMSAEQLLSDETWLRGPDFLGKPENEWPSPKTLPILTDEDQEVKKVLSANVTQMKDNPIVNLILKT